MNDYPPEWPQHIIDQLEADFQRGHEIAVCNGYCSARGATLAKILHWAERLDVNPNDFLALVIKHGLDAIIKDGAGQ